MSYGPTAADVPPRPSDTAAGVDLGRSSRRGRRGRNREWRILSAVLRAAEQSRGGVLLVEGQPGMGKSRMLDDAVEAAAGRGFMIARGAADEPSQLVPLVPLMAALGESPQTLRQVREAPSETVDLRLRLIEQLQTRLEERVSRGPLLIALDDLQWADPTTLLALRSLIPELASYPLVWILSRTTGDDLDSGVDRLFEVLKRDGAKQIKLEALSDRAMAEVITDVLGAAPGPELLALTAATGGNPFMLVELLRGLRDEGAVQVVDDHVKLVSRQLPRRVHEIARSRLTRLSPHTRHRLQVAAILGRSFRVDDLAEMFDEPPSRLRPALEEAETEAVVVPTGDQLTFRHDVLWRAVTETVTVPMRHALHRQAAEMLQRRGGSAIPAAAHLMHYARRGDARALEAFDQAVAEVLPSSPQTAADLSVRALELTAPGDPGRVDRTVTAVYALSTSGRLPEATDFARTAMGQAQLPGQAARLRYELAYALLLAGRPVDAVAEAEKALGQPDLTGELRGLVEQVLLLALYNANHDFRRGQKLAEEIVADPRQHSRASLVGARMLLSYSSWGDGDAAEGIGQAREAVRIAPSDDVRARRVHPRLQLATLLTDLRMFEEADTELQRAGEEIAEFGHTAYAASPALFRARLRLAEGRLDDAAAEAHAGVSVADQMGMQAFVLLGLAVLIIVAVHRGDIDAAAGYAERYEERFRAGARFGMAWGGWSMALLTDARDGPRKVLDVLHTAYTDPDERRWLLMSEPDAAAWLARSALAAGNRPAAETVTVTAEQLARDNPGFPALAASAAHARGILRGDRVTLSHAATAHRGPWSRASAAEDLGVLLARSRQGLSEDAIEALDRALEGYQRIGALRDAARIRARLRRLGVRRRHWTQSERPVSGWSSLTDTERNVAALAAQGLTNPQVAAQMFVSPHTVKYHLRQVFRKLGIASRVELARLAHASDTSQTPRPEG